MNKELIEKTLQTRHLNTYVKHERGPKKGTNKGCVVATANGVGWSLCHKNDNFNKDHARTIAVLRAENNSKAKVPHSLAQAFAKMQERRKRAAAFLSTPVGV